MTLARKVRTRKALALLKYKQTAAVGIGRTRRQMKTKADRDETAVEAAVRLLVKRRDGYCRVQYDGTVGKCSGPSEWAHFGESRRFKTGNQAPEVRHTVEGSLMLCQKHHHAYDNYRLFIRAIDPAKGCEGPLVFERFIDAVTRS